MGDSFGVALFLYSPFAQKGKRWNREKKEFSIFPRLLWFLRHFFEKVFGESCRN